MKKQKEVDQGDAVTCGPERSQIAQLPDLGLHSRPESTTTWGHRIDILDEVKEENHWRATRIAAETVSVSQRGAHGALE